MKSGGLYSILMLVVMFAIMYFLLIRPQKKQQQKWQDMIGNMRVGDHVITRGGLHGVIDNIDKDTKTITLDCDGIFLLFSLSAISTVNPSTQDESTIKSSSSNSGINNVSNNNDTENGDEKDDQSDSKSDDLSNSKNVNDEVTK